MVSKTDIDVYTYKSIKNSNNWVRSTSKKVVFNIWLNIPLYLLFTLFSFFMLFLCFKWKEKDGDCEQ